MIAKKEEYGNTYFYIREVKLIVTTCPTYNRILNFYRVIDQNQWIHILIILLACLKDAQIEIMVIIMFFDKEMKSWKLSFYVTGFTGSLLCWP